MFTDIVHRNTVEAGGGQLNIAKGSKLLDRMIKKQAVADDALHPSGVAGERIALLREKNGFVAHRLDLRDRAQSAMPGAGQKQVHESLPAAMSAQISATFCSTMRWFSRKYSLCGAHSCSSSRILRTPLRKVSLMMPMW